MMMMRQQQGMMRTHIYGMPATPKRTPAIVMAMQHHQDRRAQPSTTRRDLIALTAASMVLLPARTRADEFKVLRDDILAYEFVYPVATQSGRPLPVLLSRAPERYSSAAPMTADARQRIVCQLADLKDAITISVTVGPPSGVLKGIDTAAWQPKDVANTVLIDKSTARVTTGQRVSLSSLESVQSVQKGNTTYIVYEHVSQGSPRPGNTAYETYRHAYSVSATRPGLDGTPYIYSLSLACPEELWGELQVPFMTAVNSFTLVEPSNAYVAPDKDPWRFF